MVLTITKAAEMAGCNRSTIQRAIRSGKLSATRDEASGAWMIEVAELCRVWPDAGVSGSANGTAIGNALPRTDDSAAEMRELRARLADAQETIADLRRRLDQEAEERRQAQTRLTALLTDQCARAAEPATVPPDPLSPLPKLPEPEAAESPSLRRRWWRW